MWRRVYLFLAFVRLYFALCPSYLHPDEMFQGPEVIAGKIFSYPFHQTWEWTTANPIRSVFPLWLLYGFPMVLLRWVVGDDVSGDVSPSIIYYTLRAVMFLVSFVLEDWAVYELIASSRHRRQAIILVASSYVTWTFQTHTFSNSLETIIVLWSLVLIDRILRDPNHSSILACTVLAFLIVLGTFNRITFPAFIMIPGLRLIPHMRRKPFSFLCLSCFGVFFTAIAISTDTTFYHPESTASFLTLLTFLLRKPVITPLNSLLYNTSTSNLAEHGLHPHYQHFLVNLPQLLGPVLFFLILPFLPTTASATITTNPRFISAISGTFILSILPHQEARFLLPVIPLLLTCIPPLPQTRRIPQVFWATWIPFNLVFALLMGIYHQGGIIPTQLVMRDVVVNSLSDAANTTTNATVFWWKTYPPPTYLLGREPWDPTSNTTATVQITTTALMGTPLSAVHERLSASLLDSCTPVDANPASPPSLQSTATFLVFPLSALPTILPPSSLSGPTTPFSAPPHAFTLLPSPPSANANANLTFHPLHMHRTHLNLDDIEIGRDGVAGTLRRVVGLRGLGVWRVSRSCGDGE